MHVNSLLFASVVIALPLTLITLILVMKVHRWRTYRVSVDVSRPEGERPAEEPPEEADEFTESEPTKPFIRGPGGLRGRIIRNLYPYYRRR